MAAPMNRPVAGVSHLFRSIMFGNYSFLMQCRNSGIIQQRLRYYCLEKRHSLCKISLPALTTRITRPSVGTHGPAQCLPYPQRTWDFPVIPSMIIQRWMSTGLSDEMLRKELDKLTDRFMEAKELLDDARESMGSVYFNEDLTDADEAVSETLKEYRALLDSLTAEQRQNVTRTIGLRMEELSAQQSMIRDQLKD